MEAGTAVISDVFDTMERLPPVLDNSLFPIPGPGVSFISLPATYLHSSFFNLKSSI